MSTFNPPADIAQITLAKSSDVNAVKAATATAFSLLPNEDKLKQNTVTYAVDTGVANTYQISLPDIAAYTDGLLVSFKPSNSNTGQATIQINSLGARSIRLVNDDFVQSGDIISGAPIDLRYSVTRNYFYVSSNSANYATIAITQAALATTRASAAATSATNAATSATNAANSATNAANFAAGLIATSTSSIAIGTGSKSFSTQSGKQFNVGQFVTISSNATPANYMFGQVSSYSSTTLSVNVTVIGGSGTAADWNISVSGNQGVKGDTGTTGPQGIQGVAGSAGGTLTISNKTAAYTVVADDLGKIINCTSGTFSVNLTAAATLGSGFTCTIWNSSNTSTDAITIDPAGAETIDGVATLILRRGEGMDIVCNGTNWQTSYKKVMRGYAENMSPTDTRPVATGNTCVAIGNASVASANYAIALAGATASNRAAIAIGGYNTIAEASGFYSSAIGMTSAGDGSKATASGAMALGGSYASGTDSFAAAIANNTSSYGAQATGAIAIGGNCLANGFHAVSMGYGASATGVYAIAIGGSSSGISASGQSAFALGDGSAATKFGKYAYSGGLFAAFGDAQYGQIILRAATTTTTAVVLTSDAAAAGTTNQLILASGQAMAISGTLIAKQTASGNMAGWTITGIVSNNAGTMAVSGLALTAIGTDSIVLGAAPTIAVDNTNKGVTITSGYKAATSIRWVANVQTSEVTYA